MAEGDRLPRFPYWGSSLEQISEALQLDIDKVRESDKQSNISSRRKPLRVIGLISGTSADGIDAAFVNLTGTEADLQVELLAGETFSYPEDLRSRILSVCRGDPIAVSELADLDDAIASEFATATIAIQQQNSTAQLIGSHGQTVFHRPKGQTQFAPRLASSLQLGRGDAIAHLTGLPTISNFRQADIAVGGEGAPLVSRIDACLLSHPTAATCVQNVGGIGNLTYLPPRQLSQPFAEGVCGWDTGPGNSLLDLAVQKLSGGDRSYDENGNWAATGTPCPELVDRWLQHPFFQQPPPKSTGRELFGWAFLHQCWPDFKTLQLGDADILATLTELTAASIALSYRQFLPQIPDRVLLCGGGCRNRYFKQRLQALLPSVEISATNDAGLNSDFKEAIAFAILAYWYQLGIPGNLPAVTGAKKEMVLGTSWQPS